MSAWEDILEELIQQGDWNESLEHVDQRLLQTDRVTVNQTASLLVLRAQLLRELGQHAAAANTLRSAGQLAGTKPIIRLVALFESAKDFIRLGGYAEAIDILVLALELARNQASEVSDDVKCIKVDPMLVDPGFDPSAPPNEVVGRILLLRAEAARLNQNRDLALQDVSEIINSPYTSEALRAAALLDRGISRFENGESAEAIEDLMAVLAMEGGMERHRCDANYNLSLICAIAGKYSQLVETVPAFLWSPMPTLELKKNLAETIQEILADVEADEALTVNEIISSFMQNYN
jgi:tetratricopeptide (TPR) repeat protein